MPFSVDESLFSRVRHEREDMRPDQTETVEWLLANPYSALFADVGMGKAVMSLTVIVELLTRLPIDSFRKVLIVAPIRVCYQTWPTEIAEWRHTVGLGHAILRVEDDDPRVRAAGKRAYEGAREMGCSAEDARPFQGRAETQKKEELRRALLGSRATIHIIDKGSVAWLVDRCKERRDWPYDVVFVDESSCLGDHGSGIFNALKFVRSKIKRLHQLTATPAPQTYMRFFSQIWLLDEGERLGSHITPFRERYFDYNHYRRTYTLKHGGAEKIEEKLADICRIMRKDRKEDEKPLILRRPVLLSAAQMEAYQKFENDSVLELPDGEEIAADTAAALSQKLLQCASGAVYDAEKRARFFHEHKIEELRQLQEEAQDEPLLVAYWFKSSLERLRKAFPKAAVMDREGKAVVDWNKRKLPMLFVHPQSAGHGLNMQFGGHHLVLYDVFWALELFIQIVGRLDRPGQTDRVMVHLLTTIGTMDEVVADKLARLSDAQEAMYARLKAIQARLRRNALADVELLG